MIPARPVVIALCAAAVIAFVVGFGISRLISRDGDETGSVPPLSGVTAVATPRPATPEPTRLSPNVPLSIKIGQLIMAGFDGTTGGSATDLIRDEHIGNLVLLGANITSPDQLQQLTTNLQTQAVLLNGEGMLISIDQEGGRVIRLAPPFVQFPAARVIGCIGETEFARGSARVTGVEMLAAGVNVNLAPIADVTTNPANEVIGDRAFGDTPDVVVPMVAAYIEGLHEAGVAATIKHFPGHGSTTDDSHDSQVVVDRTLAELEETELPPFRASVNDADLVMMANVDYLALDPESVPAGLSAPSIAFLREELAYDGVVITDSLGMGAVSNRWSAGEAAVKAIAAGADMVLYANAEGGRAGHAALLEAVLTGEIAMTRVDEALGRILALKRRLLVEPLPALDEIGSGDHQSMADLIDAAAAQEGC